MRVAIVYESMFGSTRKVAEAIAEGVRRAEPFADLTLSRVTDLAADDLTDVDLLIVGAPTHLRGLSRPASRRHALEGMVKTPEIAGVRAVAEPGADGPGVREWLEQLPQATGGRMAAAFDTRASGPFAGRASRRIAHRLTQLGYLVIAPPQEFELSGNYGPPSGDELSRARTWGSDLVANRARHHLV
ncbi:MAG TPA: flavodoxin domain-containing protein [Acidimicrobiales bacterium]|nr:flavodoxin domain-containing protein [Acidimicrobiales bacterium]